MLLISDTYQVTVEEMKSKFIAILMPISSAEDSVRAARLWVVGRAAFVLGRGLDLLGIEIPEKM